MEQEKIKQATAELCFEADIKKEEVYSQNRINWLEEDFWDSWDKIKGHIKKTLGNKKEYIGIPEELFFLAHSKDSLTGKPQLIQNTKIRMPLIREAISKITPKKGNEENYSLDEDGKVEIQSLYLFDDKYDKRYDGFQVEVLSLDFYLYRCVSPDNKEYFLLSETELPNQCCSFSGMSVELDDMTDISRNMKLKSISRVFFVKEAIPDIKILTKEQIVQFTKLREIDSEDWINFLNYHPQGTWNVFPEETNLLRSAFLLSGKDCGYPLHLFILGKAGTKKSMGYVETLAYKFSEDFQIFEGGNSRIKGLTPSFKEKPANLGYLVKSERIGFIDELGKMVEFELNKHDNQTKNVLGETNFLLEHKRRLVGSGNDNDIMVQANAKFGFVTNPINAQRTIYDHLKIIDTTTMSRMLVWVQDEAETSFLLSSNAISKVPPRHTQAQEQNNGEKNIKKITLLKMCWGELDRNEFLTLFDTCNSFLCELNEEEVQKLVNMSINLAKEPMKSSVWKPRAEHHVKLLIDGVCKFRCLFEDYDNSFKAIQKDYDRVERILIRMILGWDTDLSPRERGKV